MSSNQLTIDPRSFFLFAFMSLAVLVFTIAPETAWAIFETNDVLPESQQDKPMLEQFLWIALIMALFFIIGITAFGGGEIIASFISALVEARKTNDWSGFFRQVGIGMMVLLIVFFVAAFFYNWITGGINLNPTVNVG